MRNLSDSKSNFVNCDLSSTGGDPFSEVND